MCEKCVEHFQLQWKGQSFSEYLDNFDFPVLIVDGDGRIAAVNRIMADMLGKTDRQVFGLLGGEAFECKYARLEEGCGQTIHCRTCTVRNLVQETYLTGESFYQVPAYVEGDENRIEFLISTVKLERSVQVVVEPLPVQEDNPENELLE
jgi:PAS domain-containing protein